MSERRPRSRAPQYLFLALSGMVLVAIWGWRIFLSSERVASPDELARLALSDAAEDERELAALRLSRHPDRPVSQIRQVFQESASVRVRAAATVGLGLARDWESIPQLIEAMEGESELLRGRAALAVDRIVAQRFGFRADAPLEERRKVIKLIELKWPRLHKGYLVKQERLRKKRAEKEDPP